jgi:hypothetical protein
MASSVLNKASAPYPDTDRWVAVLEAYQSGCTMVETAVRRYHHHPRGSPLFQLTV